ncbi:XRE family transcriptional regulator [Streptomyces sp. NRRL S-350]|uniref:XRE family transcriptional regulator n=1 Tax=Streptomyces sp. NRRL S-350 TaxID=1463902 RepID=UPI00131E26D7|nr:XRE family transcriptional regulator [Streptomyces sp. NRRL S-350]
MTGDPVEVGNPAFVTARIALGLKTQQDFVDAFEDHAQEIGVRVGISIRQVRRWESPTPGCPNRDARKVLVSMFSCPEERRSAQRILEDLGFVPLCRPPGRRPGMPRSTTPPLYCPPEVGLALPDRPDRLLPHLRAALDDAGRTDSVLGPRAALPQALAIVSSVERAAREASGSARRDLLVLGARAAEFTAWLHRDSEAGPAPTAFWHDRAIELATMAGEGQLHGYVLLRKAQAADGDPARMRDLARAAHAGPWSLPPRPRAEALQHEARALALTGVRGKAIDRLLEEAREAVEAAPPPTGPATCTGPLGEGYTLERLMVQSALCYREAGRPARSVDLFGRYLATGRFAPRDRAFFTAAMSGALVATGEPDRAADVALAALEIAAGAGFGQALAELHRTKAALLPHSRRPAVRQLLSALREVRPAARR